MSTPTTVRPAASAVTSAEAPEAAASGGHPHRRFLLAGGGACLAVAPLLFLAGAASSPPQDGTDAASYVDSMARAPFQAGVSANLLHYSWFLFALGALAALVLVRGRRGSLLTLVGGLSAAVGSIQMAGALYSDWVAVGLGAELSRAQAGEVFSAIGSAPSMAVWLISAKVLALLGFPVLFAGLARAGVLSWWLVPMSLLPMVAFGVVGGVLGLVLGGLLHAPYYVTGWRLVQRGRLAARVGG